MGCNGPHGATLYPDGIVFKSAKGYYRLGRDLSFTAKDNYIGAGVEAFNATACWRALHREDLNEVRFVLADNQTVLIYNYYFQQWSVIVTAITDATEMGGAFYGANPNAANGAMVLKENLATFTDAALGSGSTPAGYPFNITTGWIAINQLQRLPTHLPRSFPWRLQVGPHVESGVRIRLRKQRPERRRSPKRTPSCRPPTGTAYQFEAYPLRQKCEAIMLRISDPSATGESFDLTDFEFQLGMVPGRRFPLPTSKGF